MRRKCRDEEVRVKSEEEGKTEEEEEEEIELREEGEEEVVVEEEEKVEELGKHLHIMTSGHRHLGVIAPKTSTSIST